MTGISVGNSHACALNDKNELYVWGRGEYGTLGNGANKQFTAPVKNDLFDEFKEKMDITVVSMKSIFRMTSAIMSFFLF